MSDTVSVDVVGPSYWAYMAAVMGECLEIISAKREVGAVHLPKGVYQDARRFFSLVMQSVQDNVDGNPPPGSMNAYAIAAYAVKESSAQPPSKLEELDDRLKEYSDLLTVLEHPKTLTEAEAEIAKSLSRFFRRLAELGESEIYEKTVDLEPALTSYR
jgi:hypothetical protein